MTTNNQMYIGTRVVRGPDWSSKEQDGGEGHLGTIVDQSESGDKTVSVLWDAGRERIYKAKDDAFELRLFDNAQTGVNHPNCSCSGCNVKTIWGIRWLCLDCGNINLCTKCYMSDKHDINHTFGRVVEPFHSVVKLPSRNSSKNMVCQAKGLFPKAQVTRGPHWEWRNTDGGDGSEGIIDEICDWSSTTKRSAARVKWSKQKNVETYRLGAEGRVDLLYTKPGDGYKYYKQHLPVVDLDCIKKAELTIGDKVQVHLTQSQMKNIQKLSDGVWSDAMSQCLAQTGTVVQIIVAGLVRVQYQDGNMYSLNYLCLTKVHTFQKGDLVRVFGDKAKVSALQQGHGGWSDNYNQTLGKLGRVVHVDDDGDVSVHIDGKQYLFSPVCLESVDEGNIKPTEKAPPLPENLHKKRLFEPDRRQETVKPKKSLIILVLGGDVALVQDYARENPTAVNVEEDGVTAIQVACQKGHEPIVKCLIEAKADIDKPDKDGNTPLHICVKNHKATVEKLLIVNKANIEVKNKKGITPLHLAVIENRPECVRHLVEAGADLHVKSPSGGTAVHDAISNEQPHAVKQILKAKTKIKFETENADGFDMLQWACIKKCQIAVDMILNRDTSMVNRHMSESKGCYTACHIAADNDLRDIMRILVKKGKADINSLDGLQQTPLHLAVKAGHLPMAEFLLENGAKVDVQDKDGNTPLHATQILQTSPGFSDTDNNWANIACILVEHGASLKVLNKHKKSPLDIAPQVSRAYLQRLWKTSKERKQEKTGAGGGIYLPLHWRDMAGKPLLFVSLNTADPIEKTEYKHVEETLLKGFPKRKERKVQEIIRVQNKYLWELYAVKKKAFENKLGRGNENEVSLFHGTKPEVVKRICEENFDFRLAGENVGTMHGKGVYFATSPCLSDTYCSPDDQGYRHILLAKVLAGRVTFGDPELKKPPDNYDSVVDYTEKPRIYCVFDFNQCYPEYIIKYE